MRSGRRDLNHSEIRDGLRAVCGKENVLDTGDVGNGFADLVVGWKGTTYFLEVKSKKSAKLRPDQERLMGAWRGGPWVRVDSLDEALAAMGLRKL